MSESTDEMEEILLEVCEKYGFEVDLTFGVFDATFTCPHGRSLEPDGRHTILDYEFEDAPEYGAIGKTCFSPLIRAGLI